MAQRLKCNEERKLRPWAIPIGLDFYLISPPLKQTLYLEIGVQFFAGFEYQV